MRHTLLHLAKREPGYDVQYLAVHAVLCYGCAVPGLASQTASLLSAAYCINSVVALLKGWLRFEGAFVISHVCG